MTMPFYVAPEQVMKDKADYARKGIARGRPAAAVSYAEGILLVAENTSSTLRKISEIYDRIAFAGAGRYNEFDQLRVAGVRAADVKGYQYSRDDVDARSLANQYGQILGQIFTHEMKPMEVDILVAEVSALPDSDQLFHVTYEGTVIDESDFCVLGGDAEAISDRMKSGFSAGLSLDDALRLTVRSLAGSDRTLGADTLEVAALTRSNGPSGRRRCFQRLDNARVGEIIGRTTTPETDGEPLPAPEPGSGSEPPAD